MSLTGSAEAAETFDGSRYYLGDLHVHTGVSGDGGSADLKGTCRGGDGRCRMTSELHEVAKANNLDFWSLTDHVNGENAPEDDEDWLRVVDNVLSGSAPEEDYLTILGGEVWFEFAHRGLGHKTLLLMTDDVSELEDVRMEDLQFDGASQFIGKCDDIWDYAEGLEDQFSNVLLIPHHPALGSLMGTEWGCHAGDRAQWYAPAVEIYSNHGNSEHGHTEYDPAWMEITHERSVATAIDPGEHGLRLGFIAGTDSHDTRPGSVCTLDNEHTYHPYGGGLTIAALDEDEMLSREAIYEAVQDRRTYATTGPLVPVSVTYSQGGVDLGGMGADLLLNPALDLDLTVKVPEEWVAFVDDIQLITPETDDGAGVVYYDDEQEAFIGLLPASDFSGYVYPRLILDGASYYGTDSDCDDGGEDQTEQVWASPSYMTLVSTGTTEADVVDEDPCEGLTGLSLARCEGGEVWADDQRTFVDNQQPKRTPPELMACNGVHGMGLAPGALLFGMLASLRRRRSSSRPST